MFSKTAILGVALLALAACKGPVETTVAFHKALVIGDGEQALGLLSEATRAELDQRARAASTASAGVVPPDAATMIIQGDNSLYPDPGPTGSTAVSASLVSQQESQAVVEMTLGAERHTVALVRESGGWKLDLPLGNRSAQ